jgi:WD40 repeat protein
VESVTFDSAEVVVVAGAASGTIKLWDLEEAKSKLARVLFMGMSNIMSIPVPCIWIERWIVPPPIVMPDCDLLYF